MSLKKAPNNVITLFAYLLFASQNVLDEEGHFLKIELSFFE